MKNNITKTIISKCYILFIVLTLISCTGETKKNEKQKTARFDTLTDKITSKRDSSNAKTVKESLHQSVVQPLKSPIKKKNTERIENIDFNKIYEQSEVVEAIPTLSNSQIGEFYIKHFTYPDIEPMNGNGSIDLIVEKDGSISDVIVIKSIHSELDKEFIRVSKLFPKFIPGKINGTPVRSKLRMPTLSRAI